MKTIFLTMAAASVFAIAAPAAAQYPGGYANANVDARIDQLQARIQAGVRQGTISRQEAQSLRTQLRTLERLERQYSRGGLSVQERADLQQRTRSLRQQIRLAEGRSGYDRDDRWSDRDDRDCPPGLEKRNNGCVPPGQVGRDGRWEDRRDDRNDRWEDRRDDRDGRWEDRRDDRDDRWEDRRDGRIDNNRDGYDDRDLNRDGRLDSADERYQDGNRRGGLVDRVIDGVTGNGGLRVGQRATADLGPVPYEHRNHYRDGNGSYYRSDGRRIYQIDARTQTVVRIYRM